MPLLSQPLHLSAQMQNFALLTPPKEQQLQSGSKRHRTPYTGMDGGESEPLSGAPQSPGIPSHPFPCSPPCAGFSSHVLDTHGPEPPVFPGWCEQLPAHSQLLGRAVCGELFPPPAPPSSPSPSTIRTQLSSYQIFRAVKVDKQK